MYIQDKDLKFPKESFMSMKYQPYELKEKFSFMRIRQWNDFTNGNFYVSFSGGLDSTILAYIVTKCFDEYLTEKAEIHLVFSDTGLEFPELRKFTKCYTEWLQKQFPNQNIVLETIKPKLNFKQVVLKHGYPIVSKESAAKIRKLRHGNLSERYKNYLLNGDERGKLGMLAKKWQFLIDAPFDTSEKCCDEMKKKPFKEYMKKTGRLPFIGITQDESFMRERQYNKTGCNVYDAKQPKSQPIGFWTKQDVLRYAVEHDIPICEVYGNIEQTECGKYYLTGEQRTGCMFCGFGVHMEKEPNRFQRMQKSHPNQYNFCMKPVECGGLGMKDVLDYINVPTEDNQMELSDFLKM